MATTFGWPSKAIGGRAQIAVITAVIEILGGHMNHDLVHLDLQLYRDPGTRVSCTQCVQATAVHVHVQLYTLR